MSPEQARGETATLGPATDVYGLGAILYEILTGQTPYKGKSAAKVHAQVLAGPPPAPVAHRAGVPKALSAVCMKAMAREPHDRYSTAADLAQDLERWLTDEPVTACRDSWPARAGRWARRHRTSVLVGGATVAVAAVCLAAASVLLLRANRDIEQQRDLASNQRDRAGANFKLALAAVDNFHTKVSQSPEMRSRGLEFLRGELLGSAADFYQRFVAKESSHAAIHLEQGLALIRLGNLNAGLGRRDRADESYRKALGIFQKLSLADPYNIDYQVGLADVNRTVGKLHRSGGQSEPAEEAFEASIAICRRLLAKHPRDRQTARALAAAQQELGILYADTGRSDQAAAAYEQASQGYRQLLQDDPGNHSHQQDLAATLMDLGVLYVTTNRPKLAEASYIEARELNQHLVDTHPNEPEYADALAGTLQSLGILYDHTDRADEAQKAFTQAVAGFRRMAEGHPHVVDYQLSLAQAGNNLGVHFRNLALDDQAEPYYRATCDTLQRLVENYPDVPSYAVSLAVGLLNTGNLSRDLGKYAEALEAYTRARQKLSGVLAKEPRQGVANRALTLVHGGEALTLARLERPADADLAIETAFKLCPDEPPAELQYDRALVQALAGRHKAAVAEAVETSDDSAVTGREMQGLAGACALSAAAVMRDESLSPEDRNDQHEQYCRRAIELLRRAQELGQFLARAAIERLRQDSDFASVQSRGDFRELVTELEQKVGSE